MNGTATATEPIPSDETRAVSLARALIEKHGKRKFKKLIQMFESGETLEATGNEYGVSKQRVGQWKKKLGYEQTSFTLRQGVKKLLEAE